MSFWDASDNYTFEKKFSVANFTSDYQTHIWYLEFVDLWITCDKTHAIHIWDIEKEVKTASLTSSKIKSNIISVVPIDVLKLVAVASLDKLVTIWDFRRRLVVIELDLNQGGVHSVVWSASYQILITAGYENNINLWEINPNYLDVTSKGRLIGHSSMVTAVEVIEKTPMIISADDQGNIKVWDIRNLSCVQTLALGIKSTINQLIDNYKYGKLCFVGMRVNCLEFDETSDVGNKVKMEDQLWPMHTEYNFDMNEIVICTRKDVRFIDIETGRCKKIYAGLLSNEEDEITSFRLVQQNKKFILGSYRGQVNLYSYATGELIKCFEHHTNEVMTIKVDYANNLIVTSSWDSSVYIQKENNISSEIKRSLKNLHFNKEITHMELSVYHSVIITGTSNNTLYLWDYEYGKLIGCIEIEEGCEPSFLLFINGYSFLIIGDNSGRVSFLHFTRKDTNHISFRTAAFIQLSLNVAKSESDSDAKNYFANKAVVHMPNSDKIEDTEGSKLFISTNQGLIHTFDITSILELKYVKLVPHANTRSNYNADRIANEDFLLSIKNYKICYHNIKNGGGEETEESNNQAPLSLNNYETNRFKAHKDALTNLTLVMTPGKKLLSSSLDGYVKIWTVDGALIASLNINHPLPIKWNKYPESEGTYQKKILYALKVIETIFKRYKSSIFVPEAKKLSVNRFIKKFQSPPTSQQSLGFLNSARYDYETSGTKKAILTMGDEYSPRDLQFDKAKAIFQKELQGLSLRQMEITKRLVEAQKAWKDHNKISEYEPQYKDEFNPIKIAEENKEKNDFMTFLMGDNRKDLIREPTYSKETRLLAKKLDTLAAARKPRPSQKIYNNTNKRRDSFNFVTNVIQKGGLLTTPLANLYSQTNISETSEAPKSPQVAITKTSASNKEANNKDTVEHSKFHKDKVFTTHLNINIPSNPIKITKDSSTDSGPRSKSTIKQDFFEYAKEKLNSPDKYTNSNQDEEIFSSPKKAIGYQRRVKKKKFHQILTKLDDNLRKSQLSTQAYRLSQPTILTTRPDYPLASSYYPQSEKNSNKNFTTTFQFENRVLAPLGGSKPHARNSSLPGIKLEQQKPVVKDINEAKKWIEDNWGLKVGESPKNRTVQAIKFKDVNVPTKKKNAKSMTNRAENPEINTDSLAFVFEKERSSFTLPLDSQPTSSRTSQSQFKKAIFFS